MDPELIRFLLSLGIDGHWQRLERPMVEECFTTWQGYQGATLQWESSLPALTKSGLALCRFLLHITKGHNEAIDKLHTLHSNFSRNYGHGVTQEEKQSHILKFAAAMGASRRQLARDKQAFNRWFGLDTVVERYHLRILELERRMAFALRQSGRIAAHLLSQEGEQVGHNRLWQWLSLEEGVKPYLAHGGDHRLRLEAFRCLSVALQAMPADLREGSVAGETLHYVYRIALQRHTSCWIQCEAILLLTHLSLDSFITVAKKRLQEVQEGDDMFVRRRTVIWLAQQLHRQPELHSLLTLVLQDGSPFVRQGLAEAIPLMPAETGLNFYSFLLGDDSPQVRTQTLLSLQQGLSNLQHHAPLRNLLCQVLAEESHPLPLRLALEVAGSACPLAELGQHWQDALLPHLEHIHQNGSTFAVRRWAAMARERLWGENHPIIQPLLTALRQHIANQPPGSVRLLPPAFKKIPVQERGRLLALLSQKDFPLEMIDSWPFPRLQRGYRFGFRLWRFLHEMAHPATEKRQAFSHTIGRLFYGTCHAPSAILAELAETKVVGEPLHISSEGGWRPYLPLVDHLISALDNGVWHPQTTRIHTAEGVTEIIPPASLWRRFTARLALTRKFAFFAKERNFQESSQNAPDTYLQQVAKLGITVRLVPHGSQTARPATLDSAVVRFFPAWAAWLPVFSLDWWPRFESYFYSAYENSLQDLALFTVVAMVLFFGRHLRSNWQMRNIRKALPLVIGGWGTRGKSGTERLKAAFFNSLGLGVVSKTTGCEAMFLYSPPLGKLREMFLFRPYDKATIWEQFHVARMAKLLKSHVFLWECMALTPSYVEILQQRWMRDDLSTITNTFPDHEDIQGPAGKDIPQVMTCFIPSRSTLLTTEEQMRPILAWGAQVKNTRLVGVDWLHSGLLTPDILDRFPYQEHPDNIALVKTMAAELGIDGDFAVKEMADRVVPDLGVLKTSPIASLAGRRLQFTNGMSANERYGCLANWLRLGFDQHHPRQEPGVMLSTVVNNRADRVARSRVFAGILVNDIGADRHFLIGGNLHGLMGYIQEAWQQFIQPLTLWPPSATATPVEILTQHAHRLRIPTSRQQVFDRLAHWLIHFSQSEAASILAHAMEHDSMPEGEQLDEVRPFFQEEMERWHAYQTFYQSLSQDGGDREKHNATFASLLQKWFFDKFILIEDYHAKGDQVIDIIRRATPPGVLNRIMGIQNIKGTGLDFVYRWQAWESCHRACSQLLSRDQAPQGLAALLSFQEWGILCEEYARQALEKAAAHPALQNERARAELALVTSRMSEKLDQVKTSLGETRRVTFTYRLIGAIEAFLDAGDAVTRRKLADQIFQDLVDERISQERAVVEMKLLNSRQKGGWLYQRLKDLRSS